MNSKTNNGGAAFPSTILSESEMRQNEHGHSEIRTDNELNIGMSLRDYFAAKAMQSLIAIPIRNLTEYESESKLTIGEIISARSYAYADAMIAERDK